MSQTLTLPPSQPLIANLSETYQKEQTRLKEKKNV
jgi:hypothetical protein